MSLPTVILTAARLTYRAEQYGTVPRDSVSLHCCRRYIKYYVYTFVGKGKRPSGTSLIEYSLETSRRLREVMTPSRLVFLDKLISPLYKNNENWCEIWVVLSWQTQSTGAGSSWYDLNEKLQKNNLAITKFLCLNCCYIMPVQSFNQRQTNLKIFFITYVDTPVSTVCYEQWFVYSTCWLILLPSKAWFESMVTSDIQCIWMYSMFCYHPNLKCYFQEWNKN